jgi:quercetin dioxygenase-like cupin family protein
VRGKVIFHFVDRSEIYQTGDAYYAPPGHVPVVSAGTELVEFSDSEEFGRTIEAIGRNLAAMQTA